MLVNVECRFLKVGSSFDGELICEEGRSKDFLNPKIMDPSTRESNPVRLPIIWFLVSFTISVVILFTLFGSVTSCNEAVCASIVSKCTLTKSCKCEMKNCSCCKECFDCLNYLYSECCSCVELCPKPNASNHLLMLSQVGDLKEPMPDLFSILTNEIDAQGRWTTFTFPIDIDPNWFQPKPNIDYTTTTVLSSNVEDTSTATIDLSKEIVTVNCTVAYMSECMPMNKCRNSCHSMGSSYFRWFHDGCCECIGRTCINYGIDESRCASCSLEDDIEEDPESDLPEDNESEDAKTSKEVKE